MSRLSDIHIWLFANHHVKGRPRPPFFVSYRLRQRRDVRLLRLFIGGNGLFEISDLTAVKTASIAQPCKQLLSSSQIAKGKLELTLIFQRALVFWVDRQRLVIGRLGCHIIAQLA